MSVPPFTAGYRASGVLLHVTSLPSPYGIGDVGPAAVAWIDRLHEAGQSWWQEPAGSAQGNWRWRATDDMLSASALESLGDLTLASARTEPAMAASS